MVNVLSVYMFLLRGVMKMAGVTLLPIELEPGTLMYFLVPTQTISQSDKNHKTSKPALVFLHGFALNGILSWQFQVLALAREYAVYVPDFIFFGDSATDKADRSPDFQAKCVARGLRKLGVEKCTLVGFSYGGIVGFRMAELYPEMVESMVMSGTVMALTESISRSGLERVGFSSWADYLLPDTAEGLKKTLDMATHSFPCFPNFVYKHVLEVMFHHRKERTEMLDALVVKDTDFRCPRHPQRIHILCGEEDKIFSLEVAVKTKEILGNRATLHVIEKAGHFAQAERPFVYNSHLKKILASNSYDDGKQK